jgi:5-(carboxyamino)imidazole ribonucleotide synthase
MSEDSRRAPLPPGSTIGILGSGQLGRMLAMAAARLGLRTHVYCADSGPAFDVATRTTKAAFDDTAALSVFRRNGRRGDLRVRERRRRYRPPPCRPGSRAAERQGSRGGAGPADGEGIHCRARHPRRTVPCRRRPGGARRRSCLPRRAGHPEVAPAGLRRQGPGARRPGEDAAAAWAKVGGKPAVLEKRIPFTLELSALVVRGQDGASAFYDCPRNTHEGGILRRSVVPSGLPPADLARARDIAGTIAGALDYIGVLAVEMFYLGADAPEAERLMVNEIAPRVHNSGHWTIEACAISQFENHIRAVAGWPLGSTARHSDAEMVNLIGREALDWQRLAAEPGASLHLYGKREARAGRKMGHVTRLLPAIPRS